MYFEDNDWCLRLRQAGWKIYYVPQVQVTHLGGQSLAHNPAARGVYAQSLRYFYRKHYPVPAQWLLRLLLPIYQRVAG
jgi:GT2 family glycosyltransferase